MTGLVATLLAVGVIAGLIFIGIRTKLPPPDPDWRRHLPPPAPPPSRWWVALWLSRYAFLLAGVAAAAFGQNTLAIWLALLMVAITFVGVFFRVRLSRQFHREWKQMQEEQPGG